MPILTKLLKNYQDRVNARKNASLEPKREVYASIKDLPDEVLSYIVSLVNRFNHYKEMAKLTVFGPYIGLISDPSIKEGSRMAHAQTLEQLYYPVKADEVRWSVASLFIVRLHVTVRIDSTLLNVLSLLVKLRKYFYLEIVGDDENNKLGMTVDESHHNPFRITNDDLSDNALFQKLPCFLRGVYIDKVPNLHLLSRTGGKDIEAYYFMKLVSEIGVQIFPCRSTTHLITSEKDVKSVPGLEKVINRALNSSSLISFNAGAETSRWLGVHLKDISKKLKILSLWNTNPHDAGEIFVERVTFSKLTTFAMLSYDDQRYMYTPEVPYKGFCFVKCEFPVLQSLQNYPNLKAPLLIGNLILFDAGYFGRAIFERCIFARLKYLILTGRDDMMNCSFELLKTVDLKNLNYPLDCGYYDTNAINWFKRNNIVHKAANTVYYHSEFEDPKADFSILSLVDGD